MNPSVVFDNFSHPLSLVSVILLQLSLVICVSVLYFQCSNDDKNSHEVKFPNSAKYMVKEPKPMVANTTRAENINNTLPKRIKSSRKLFCS